MMQEESAVMYKGIIYVNSIMYKRGETDVYILWLGKMEYNGTYGKPHCKAI
jgi:hypothetical protein